MAHEHNGHRSRLRDRVRKDGLDNFQDYQVLEYALTFAIPYKDTNVIAHKLINKFGSFSGVLEADEEELMSVDGMGEVSAHYLTHLLDIYHYYEKDRAGKSVIINNPQQVHHFVKQFLKGKLVEEMYVVCISPKNKVLGVEKISEGNDAQTSANIRLIMDKLTRSKVSNIVVAHNHPKGVATSSEDDHKFTKALVTTLAISGAHLMDHIIIGEDDYYSYRRSGLIDKFLEEAADLVTLPKVSQPSARYDYEVVEDDKK